VALAVAGGVALLVLAVLWVKRSTITLAPLPRNTAAAHAAEGSFTFLRIPAVWMCFAFFLVYACVLSGVQSFAPQAARQLHEVPVALAAACLTVYMICSAGGNLAGGFLASDPARCEKVFAAGFATAAVVALAIGFAPVPALAVPVLFGAMGFASGLAGPSRDMLVKRSTPDNASGRVYGVVYSGMDIGQAFAPLVFGALMDRQQFQGVWMVLVGMQVLLIASGLRVRHVRRTPFVPA
jgi:FSR family fosmidomycin resistance protein-like MFS transporter